MSATVHEFTPQNEIRILISTVLQFPIFVFSQKCYIKSCLSFQDLSANKCSWYHVEWCKFISASEFWTSVFFEWLKLRGWKLWHLGHRQWHEFPTEFHTDPLIGSKLLGAMQTDRTTVRQNGYLISFTFLFKKSRLIKQTSTNLWWSDVSPWGIVCTSIVQHHLE
jgi:hypothetical protein